MKTFIATILAGLLSGSLVAETADQYVAAGLADLAHTNLVAANQQFIYALGVSNTYAPANALVAVTRLLLLPTTPAGNNFLDSWGFSKAGRNIYNWTSSLPVDVKGDTVVPPLNTSTIVDFCQASIMPALFASRTNLAMITDPNFTLSLTTNETFLEAVTLDYGDILLLQALERVAEFAGYTASAQNSDVVISRVVALAKSNGLTIQSALALYPSLLTAANTSDLVASKGALTNAIKLYFSASDFIRNVRAPSTPALFILSPDKTNDEAIFRTELTNVLLSLNGPVQITAPAPYTFDPLSINAGNYFSGARTLRSLLPPFNGDVYLNDTLPDYTFGGVLLNEPAYRTEKVLRKEFSAHAGIYIGDGGLSDNNAPVGTGNFAVFVGTNHQATLIGYDDGTDFPVFDTFTLNLNIKLNGKWSFTNANANASGDGSIGRSGDFRGEVDYPNYLTVSLTGNEQSAYGPFQNEAGYYNGTFSSDGSPPNNSGKFFAILAADGELFFQPVNSAGTPSGGGHAKLDANNSFTTTQVDGTVVTGTLTNRTLTIGGNTSHNGIIGKFTMTRSAKVPFDSPPVITTNLPSNLFAPLGTSLTISLVATGSPPMCFQWHAGSNAISFATTNLLFIPYVQPGTTGSYSVTINNCAGGTNAAVTVLVAPETNAPISTTNGVVFIPAGSFRMGDANDGNVDGDAALTSVFVSTFYMETNLVSCSQWQTVYDWAITNGYAFTNAGAGKAANHPVQMVDWYDAVKWCNARSQMAGLQPVYYTDTNLTQVYTAGETDAIYVNWTTNGYRLPTEAEWEKAARGGISGHRFPWGNTNKIGESQANYYGAVGYDDYDLGPTGYHTNWDNGVEPYTSPVGSFAANGYGLYDMAGNVYEWCWDWYGTPYGQPTTNNPTGPSSGNYRVARGGGWDSYAFTCRTADRSDGQPAIADFESGFRSVLSSWSNGVSHVRLTPLSTPRMVLSAPRIAVGNHNFSFQLSAPAGSNYVLQVSTNLLNWSPVSTSTVPVSGILSLTNNGSGYSRRFYRVLIP